MWRVCGIDSPFRVGVGLELALLGFWVLGIGYWGENAVEEERWRVGENRFLAKALTGVISGGEMGLWRAGAGVRAWQLRR